MSKSFKLIEKMSQNFESEGFLMGKVQDYKDWWKWGSETLAFKFYEGDELLLHYWNLLLQRRCENYRIVEKYE